MTNFLPHFLLLPETGAEGASSLNLADRRGLATYQEQILPGLLAPIRAALSPEVELVIDWEKIAVPGYGARYHEPEFYSNIYFVPLAAALAEVGRDPMGKQALQAIRKIHFTYNPDTAPLSDHARGLTLKSGVLEVNFRPWVDASDQAERVKAIVEFLEAHL